MNSPGTGSLHLVRVALLTAAVLGLTTGLHGAVGGATPQVVPFLALGAVTCVAVRWIARQELSFPRLLAVLGPVQVLLHLGLEGAAAPGGAPAVAAHAAHDHGAVAAEASAASSSLLMVAAHVVATFAVALVLRYGEAVLWRLWAWLTCRTLPGRPRAVVVPRAFPHPDLATMREPAAPWKARGRAPPAAA
ncbi:hypothetical protein [Myceligenerans crystallogenes]|uniref:hypothetical protein n=1 Tax=Myceligenerans crystallogenes TaxID=316335 RepID=UPI0031D3C7B2